MFTKSGRLQLLNGLISDLLEMEGVDGDVLGDMVTDYVSYCRALINILGLEEPIVSFIELLLEGLGSTELEGPLKTLFIVFSALGQFQEKASAGIIKEYVQKYLKSAQDELNRSAARDFL